MAEALIRGLVRGNHIEASRVHASAPRVDRQDELKHAYGIHVTADNREVARRSNVIVLSVKPQIMDKVLREIADLVKGTTLVISIAAGIDTETIERAFGET